MTGRAKRIMVATVTVAVLSLAVKVLATVKESLVAFRLGTDPALDAFILAYLVPSFLSNVIAGSLASAFIPVFVHESVASGQDSARRLLGEASTACLLALSVSAVVAAPLLAASLPHLGGAVSPATLRLATLFTYCLLPSVPLVGLAALWSAALNSREKFLLSSLPPVLTPTVIMLALWLAWAPLGIYTLVFGNLAGAVLELVVIGVLVRRQGLQLFAWVSRGSRALKQVIQQFLPAAAGSVLMSSTLFVDQIMAAGLGDGNVSRFLYASKITGAIVSISTMALATALLPHLSRMLADRDWGALRHVLRSYVLLVAVVAMAATVMLVSVSRPLVGLFFERGAFTAADAAVVSVTQQMLLLQILPISLGMIAVRLISALRANHVLLWGALISVVVNVALNWLFMRFVGLAGIGLSTSVVYLVSCGFLWFHALRRLDAANESAIGVGGAGVVHAPLDGAR